MPDTASIITFLTAALIITIVPGPTVTLTIAGALTRGPVAGLAIMLGTELGAASMILVVAAGMEALVGFMGWAFDWIKLIGAAYLIWLGMAMLRSSGRMERMEARHRSLKGYVLQGFVVMWSNPKALILFGAFLPQFVVPSAPAAPQILVLGGLFMLAATVTDLAYVLIAGVARRWITSSRIRAVSRTSGVMLMLGGGWLALQQRA